MNKTLTVILLLIVLGFMVGLIAVGVRADSVQGDKTTLTFQAWSACDSVRLIAGWPDTTANPDTLKVFFTAFMNPAYSNDSTIWLTYKPAGFDSLGTFPVLVKYYRGGIEKRSSGTWCVIADTSSMQGSASGLTAGDVSDAVLDSLRAYGMMGAGTGTEKDTVVILRNTDSTAVQGYIVTARPHGGGLPHANGLTDMNGKLVTSLNVGYVDWEFYKQGWVLADSNNYHVTGDGTITFYAAQVNDIGQTTIVARLVYGGADTITNMSIKYRPVIYDTQDSVWRELRPGEPLTVGTGIASIAIAKSWKTVNTSTSAWTFGLYSNEDMSNTSTRYEFLVQYRSKDAGSGDYITEDIVVAVPKQAQFNPFAE